MSYMEIINNRLQLLCLGISSNDIVLSTSDFVEEPQQAFVTFLISQYNEACEAFQNYTLH